MVSEAELVRRCLNGDRSAFGELVERYRDRAVGFCCRQTGDFEAAQDLAQERHGTRRLFCLRGLRLRGVRSLGGLWPLLLLRLLRRLRRALRGLWPLCPLPLLRRLRQLGDHPALLIKDIGRGHVAPWLRFGVLLVRLLRRCQLRRCQPRRCQQQPFQASKALL